MVKLRPKANLFLMLKGYHSLLLLCVNNKTIEVILNTLFSLCFLEETKNCPFKSIIAYRRFPWRANTFLWYQHIPSQQMKETTHDAGTRIQKQQIFLINGHEIRMCFILFIKREIKKKQSIGGAPNKQVRA